MSLFRQMRLAGSVVMLIGALLGSSNGLILCLIGFMVLILGLVYSVTALEEKFNEKEKES